MVFRCARVVSRAKSKVKSIDNAFASPMLLKSKNINTSSRRHSLTAAFINSKAKAVIREGRTNFLCVTRRHSLNKKIYCLEKLKFNLGFKIIFWSLLECIFITNRSAISLYFSVFSIKSFASFDVLQAELYSRSLFIFSIHS